MEGDAFSFANLKDKRVLIVNTASRCGYTPQYKSLETLHNHYKDQGLVILGFLAIKLACKNPVPLGRSANFAPVSVSFQMMSKVKVKGDNRFQSMLG